MAFEGIGAAVRRKEDVRFLTGRGNYTDDLNRPGQVHAYLKRSDRPHARIDGIDIARAQAAPGVLAVFVGYYVISNVAHALHTPLMSETNAISGIIVIGGMLQVSGPPSSPVVLLGAAAILLATINIAGGFLVTQRMLKMFRR